MLCPGLEGKSQIFKPGDLFLAQGGGIIQWRDSNGVLIKTINTGDGTLNGGGAGMRHHPITGELWVTNFFPAANPPNKGVRIIHTDGTIGTAVNTGPYQKAPESIVFDKLGNAYVGGPIGECVKISPDGSTILDHFPLPDSTTSNGPDWIELDPSDSIIYYTNERPRIHRYNVKTHIRLPDFANLTGSAAWLFAVRLLHGDSLLVATTDQVVYKLAPNGSMIKTYSPTNMCGFFSLAGTPDGKSFWAGGLAPSGPIYKFNLATGTVQNFFTTGLAGQFIQGIAVVNDALVKTSANTGNGGNNSNDCMRIYQNPNNGSFTIQTNLTGSLVVRVFNVIGQLVFKQAVTVGVTTNKIPLNLSYKAGGVYLVELISREGICVKKIMIGH